MQRGKDISEEGVSDSAKQRPSGKIRKHGRAILFLLRRFISGKENILRRVFRPFPFLDAPVAPFLLSPLQFVIRGEATARSFRAG